jgi:hypothetical protein
VPTRVRITAIHVNSALETLVLDAQHPQPWLQSFPVDVKELTTEGEANAAGR